MKITLGVICALLTLAPLAWGQETTRFIYDDRGRRIEKSTAHLRTSTLMGGSYEVVSGTARSTTNYIHGPGGLVALIGAGGVQYLHPDHLGSVSVVTDSRGLETARYLYTPYGELVRSHSSGLEASRYKFTGQEEDAETGLQYYIARYRDPETTLWLSADTVNPSQDIFGYNRFSYVRANPLRYSDPTGHEPDEAPALHVLVRHPGMFIGCTPGGVCGGSRESPPGWPEGRVMLDRRAR